MPSLAILGWHDSPVDQIKIALDAFKLQGYTGFSYTASSLLLALSQAQPDLILIWNRHQGIDALPEIRKLYQGKIFFFNWDDPHSILRSTLQYHIDGIDHVFSSCRSTEETYLTYGAKTWSYLPPFYCSLYHYPNYSPDYHHDVAFVCTNLYPDNKYPGQIISRLDLITALDLDPTIDFGLYGPSYLQDKFPNSYRGPVDYKDNRKIFSSALVNISTHVENGDDYINERCITILGSGGLLLVDNVKGMKKMFPSGCIIMKPSIDEIMMQIRSIILDYSSMQTVRKLGQVEVESYNINRWVSKILEFV